MSKSLHKATVPANDSPPMRPQSSTASAAKSPASLSEGLDQITKAMAYEAKYARTDQWGNHIWVTVPHTQCGVHPQSRDGFYTSGDAVLRLAEKILTEGFSIKEANDHGVGIEERRRRTHFSTEHTRKPTMYDTDLETTIICSNLSAAS